MTQMHLRIELLKMRDNLHSWFLANRATQKYNFEGAQCYLYSIPYEAT